ncbi:MAG TPA: SCO family protein [Anaerolineales bacterium]|jgi:protein SCO1/2
MTLDRRSLLLIAALIVLAAAGVLIYATSAQSLVGAVIEPPKPMPNFTLQSAAGPVSLEHFRGKLVVLFFGYTNCGDVCPLTLANLRQAMTLLDKQQAGQVQVLFVSVDWKRDTPAKLADYAHAFNPGFIGLTGSQAQIDSVTRDYGIFYQLNAPDAKGFYTVDHTSSSLILNRQGELVVTWPYGMQPSELASDLKILLRK